MNDLTNDAIWTETVYVPATPEVIRFREKALAAESLKGRATTALNKATGLSKNADFVAQLEALLKSFEAK